MKAETERSVDSGIITVRLVGELTTATVPAVRDGIGKAAAQCPVAVIVDLSRLRADETPLACVLVTATDKAHQTWGVPVLLCAAGDGISRALRPFRSFVAVYSDEALARFAVHAHVPRWIHRRFAPLPANTAVARAVAGDACSGWRLPHLRDRARLVAAELAENAIKHAATEYDLMVCHTGRYLRIAVRDGSRTVPSLVGDPPTGSAIMAAGTGRGMRIIAAACTHCGVTRTADGKIVWALMAARRP